MLPVSILIAGCFMFSSCTNKVTSSYPPDPEQGSRITSIELNNEKIDVLTNLGMLWGFLKYYHPVIAKGNYNWDKALFYILPQVLQSSSTQEAYRKMEAWVDYLGAVPVNTDVDSSYRRSMKTPPAYGYLFVPGKLPASLVKKLARIRDNYRPPQKHHYVDFSSAGNPVFTNELLYDDSPYPDAGVRLLALYRYWNMVQYFFPYRHLIPEDWNKVLSEFIPRFVNTGNKYDYMMASLQLISRIRDTHANIWSENPTLDKLKGKLITPFQAKFIEGKLVVTGYYADLPQVKAALQIGDIIEEIDGVPVDPLVKRLLPITSASNYERQLHDVRSARGFLLRSNKPAVKVTVNHDGELKEVSLTRILLNEAIYEMDYPGVRGDSGYKLLRKDIGYIYPYKLKETDFNAVQQLFWDTKALIIDLRCYPATFMPLRYGAWLKAHSSPFALFTQNNLKLPGATMELTTVSNGGGDGIIIGYTGKLVMIVNASTLSQAEYTAMALGSVPQSVVIGSQTAGADGNVSNIDLPGGIKTMFSGLGVYYPDRTETQQVGVKIDIPVKPTIRGIRENRDELLEKAIEIIDQAGVQ